VTAPPPDARRPARLLPVTLATFAYLGVAVVAALGRSNWEFVMYIAVVLLAGGVIAAVHRRTHLSSGVLWALSAWGLAHMLGGLMPVPESWPIAGDRRVLYSLWLVPQTLKYDQVVHAYGFGVATVLCWQGLGAIVHGPGGRLAPAAGPLLLAILAACGLGAVNELVEFAAVLLIPDTNVGGYENTGWDLVANLVGALIAALGIALAGGTRTGRRTES